MPVLIGANGGLDVVDPVERVDRGNLVRSNQIHRQVQQFAHPHDRLHPVDLSIGGGNADAANLVPANALTRLLLNPLVGFDRGLVDPSHQAATDGMGNLSRRMPGRAASQLSLFEQDRIGPTVFGQLKLRCHAHDPATNDGDLRGADHVAHPKDSFAGLMEALAVNRVQAISTSKPSTTSCAESLSKGALTMARATDRPNR